MNGMSIVVPTLRRTSFVMNTLKDLVRQNCCFSFEILVVDQSPEFDNELSKFANAHEFVHYHHVTSFTGLPEARNYGLLKSIYDYVLFVDDDIECNENLIQEHYSSLSKPSVAVVAGGITERFRPNIDCKTGSFSYWTAVAFRGFHLKGKGYVCHAGGGNFSIKRDIAISVGGFDEALTRGAALYEETDFCLRVKLSGYSIWYNSSAHVYHLAADQGGCRTPDIKKYLYSLVRNRSIIIFRYLGKTHSIFALIYLFKTFIAYLYKDRLRLVDIKLFLDILML